MQSITKYLAKYFHRRKESTTITLEDEKAEAMFINAFSLSLSQGMASSFAQLRKGKISFVLFPNWLMALPFFDTYTKNGEIFRTYLNVSFKSLWGMYFELL